MYKKPYLMPPKLMEEVKWAIPRSVTLQRGYRLIAQTGIAKFASCVLPRFKDKAFLEGIAAEHMRLGGVGISVSMWLFFDTKKELDSFAARVKGARNVLRKRYIKEKCFTYHVIIAIFRSWLDGYFSVDFIPTVSRR